MAYGFPAYHTENFSEELSKTDIHSAVRGTLKSLCWMERESNDDLILASSSMNIRSWGKKIVITFNSDESITITSKCALPTQCLDWGKNKANVLKFKSEIKKYI